MAASFASSKSRPCSMSSAPNARITAFFSVELPCGTTMVTAIPACAPAKASDWPWLPRVAVTIPCTYGRVVLVLHYDFHTGQRLEQRPSILWRRRDDRANQRNHVV